MTSNPPEPSSSSRAWTFTSTSSPTSTGPVSDGYATHGAPSTSSRTRLSCCSRIAETWPRRRLSGIPGGVDERERHLDHLVQVGDRDPLVGRVDVGHSVREVDALQAPLVEDVGVRAPAREDVGGLAADTLERLGGELDGEVVAAEPVPGRDARDLRLDLALLEAGGEGDGLDHLADQVGQLARVVAPRFRRELAPLGHDVPGRPA